MSRFKCYRCGWCCRIEKYSSQEEFDLAKEALRKQGIKLHGIKMPTGMVLWDKPCPALKMTKKGAVCLIYDKRPYPCRQFLCGKQFEKDKRPFLSDLQFNMKYYEEMLEEFPAFARIKEKIEDKAAKWGNNHGWCLKKIKP